MKFGNPFSILFQERQSLLVQVTKIFVPQLVQLANFMYQILACLYYWYETYKRFLHVDIWPQTEEVLCCNFYGVLLIVELNVTYQIGIDEIDI